MFYKIICTLYAALLNATDARRPFSNSAFDAALLCAPSCALFLPKEGGEEERRWEEGVKMTQGNAHL